jgi:hypothetical protein
MPTEGDTNADDIVDESGETKPRGAVLKGPDQKDAVDHASSDPDNSVYLNDEQDTLYDDGLVIGDDSDTLLGTHGNPLP